MSIASELQNYADGLDDAWDAAEDMGATIPHDRNMVNLDDAIRTIPVSSPNDGVLTITQNGVTIQTFSADQATNVTAALTDTTYTAGTGINISAQNVISAAGGTITTFHWGGSPNYSMYKDSGYTTAATYSDIATAYADGLVYIADGEDEVTYVVVSDIPDAYTITVTGIGLPDYEGGSTSYAYASSTWTKTATEFQKKLTAGTNVQINGTTISATDTTYSDFTGATSSVAGAHGLVPAPTTSDPGKFLKGDGTWGKPDAELVEMYYGESNAWAKFIDAYTRKCIVYCRASSNSNPGSGAKTRKAFMAYVNNEDNPTNVEFQYVRSQSSKTDSQQTDQVFVYTLTNASGGTWSVASRNMGPKINVSGPITKTFTNGANATITIGADAMTGATSGAAGAAGVVPAPAAGDQSKVLLGGGTWSAVTGDMLDYSSAAGTAVIKTITDSAGRTGIYFSDGTLIATRKVQWTGTIDTSWGTLYEGHTTDYYKFAPTDGDDFVSEPNVQVTVLNNATTGSCWLGAWENSAQIVSGGWAIPAGALCFLRASAMSSNVTLNLYIQATGRWKA